MLYDAAGTQVGYTTILMFSPVAKYSCFGEWVWRSDARWPFQCGYRPCVSSALSARGTGSS
jgi:hypothetical protein